MATQGLEAATADTQAQATVQDAENAAAQADWRVRLSLAPGANYLYKDNSNLLLAPLAATDGVIFPYTPTISVTYGATYNAVSPVHSNYKIQQYESSYVDNISITCDFTAQDTYEANYILAVITFFKSVTKMFYGQDENPKPGTPPPLCFLSGLGEFQFNRSPLAITNFTYNLPNDVDYIRAGTQPGAPGTVPNASGPQKPGLTGWPKIDQILSTNTIVDNALSVLGFGGNIQPRNGFGLNKGFNSIKPPGTEQPTYVPTKISISISAVPIVSRYDVSNVFSLKDYANGKLIRRGAHW